MVILYTNQVYIMKIPDNYLPVMPYLVLDRAVEFKQFCEHTFNASEQMIVPGEDSRVIMHGELKINNAVIMFANSNDNWKQKTSGMFIFVENVDTVYKRAIEAGSTSLQKPTHEVYGYAAGFEDPFGNHWWINEIK